MFRILIAGSLLFTIASVQSNTFAQIEKGASTQKSLFAGKETFRQWGYEKKVLEKMFLVVNQGSSDPVRKFVGVTDDQKQGINNAVTKLLIPRQKEISELQEEVEKCRKHLAEYPDDRLAKMKFEEAEEHFHESISDLFEPAYEAFQKKLKKDQYKKLLNSVRYAATAEYFREQQIHSFDRNDSYLDWPLWVAEAERLDSSLLRKIEKAVKAEKKLLKKKVAKILAGHVRSAENATVQNRRDLIRRYTTIIKERKQQTRRKILGQILQSKTKRKNLELTSKQEAAILQLRSASEKLSILSSDSESKKRPSHSTAILLKVKGVLNPVQQQTIEKQVEKMVCDGVFKELHPYYEKALQQQGTLEEPEKLGLQLWKLEQESKGYYQAKTKLENEAIDRILKKLPRDQRQKLEKFLGRKFHILDSLRTGRKSFGNWVDSLNPPKPR